MLHAAASVDQHDRAGSVTERGEMLAQGGA